MKCICIKDQDWQDVYVIMQFMLVKYQGSYSVKKYIKVRKLARQKESMHALGKKQRFSY